MEGNYSKIRNKMSSAVNAYKQKMEDLYGKEVRSKSYKKQTIISFVILVCFLLSMLLNDLYDSNKLSKYGVETNCTISEIFYSVRSYNAGKFPLRCVFKINGVSYTAKRPVNRPLNIGDTLRVLYYPKNPKINRLVLPDSLTTSKYNYLENRYED